MLEQAANQAAGLLTLASPQGPRLMAMVSHGDEESDLALLWRICSTMVDFGYSVTVLDASTRESDHNPGLEQLLEHTYWHGCDSLDAPDWTVIPAGMGLQTLCTMPERQQQSLQLLGHLFQHEGALIVYGAAPGLAPLLSDTGLKPLLAVAPARASLITSYRALKQLLLTGRLEPTIVNLVQTHNKAATPLKTGSVAASLSECARNFLGYEVNALNIAAPRDDDRPSTDLQHLALRMLENAMPLNPGVPDTMRYAPHQGMGTFARNH